MRTKLKLLFINATGFTISNLFLLKPVTYGQRFELKTSPLAAGMNFIARNCLPHRYSSWSLPEINYLMRIKKICRNHSKATSGILHVKFVPDNNS